MKTTLNNLSHGYIVTIPYSGMRGGRLRADSFIIGGAETEQQAIERAHAEILRRFPCRSYQHGTQAVPAGNHPRLAAHFFVNGQHD